MTDDLAAFLDAVETRAPKWDDAVPNRVTGSDVPVLVAGWRKVLALCDESEAQMAAHPEYGPVDWAEIRTSALRAALVEALSPTPTPTAEETT